MCYAMPSQTHLLYILKASIKMAVTRIPRTRLPPPHPPRQGSIWADELDSDSGEATVLALSPAQRPGAGYPHRGGGGRDDGTVTASSVHRDETWQIDLGRSVAQPRMWKTPLLMNSRLSIPSAGDAETLAVLGSRVRLQAHLWKYMLSEVRPHELYTTR